MIPSVRLMSIDKPIMKLTFIKVISLTKTMMPQRGTVPRTATTRRCRPRRSRRAPGPLGRRRPSDGVRPPATSSDRRAGGAAEA